jgi:hypothetical protein
MSSLCSNCEFVEACNKCIECFNNIGLINSIFCNECSDLHKNIKKYKSHQLVKYSNANERNRIVICENCDQQPAKFICMKCPEKSQYFCGGCSIMHTKIKLFRDHITLPLGTRVQPLLSNNIDNNKIIRRQPLSDIPTTSTLSDSNNIITIIYENILTILNKICSSLDIPIDFESFRHRNVKDTGYGIIIALIIYTLSKILLGRYGTGISIVGTIMIWRIFVKYERNKIENVTNKFNENINNVEENLNCNNNNSMENEFWHYKPSKPSSFKPRGRSFNQTYRKKNE